MTNKPPPLKSGDWIKVADKDCMVTEVAESDEKESQCEVIFDPDNPRHGKVTWDGEKWVFPATGESGYAEKQPRLGMHVSKLKQGPGK